MSTPKTFCIKQLLTFCYLDLFGIPSEGDKRDSKHGLASHDFAPKPASGTRPGRIYGMYSFGGYIKPVQLERVNAAGWDGE